VNPVRKRWVWLACVAVAAAMLFFPFQYEVTPAWSFDVVGADNKARPNCVLVEHWEWLAVGLQREETATSDAGGRVHFPARTIRASWARQSIGTLRGFGFHSAFMGPRAYFLGCGPGKNRDRLDAEKVGNEVVYRYVPGAQAPIKPVSGGTTQ
jgi:hypothetical protein